MPMQTQMPCSQTRCRAHAVPARRERRLARRLVLGAPLAAATLAALAGTGGPLAAEGAPGVPPTPTPRPVPQRTPVPPRRPVGTDAPVTAVLAEGHPVAVSVYGRPGAVAIDSVSAAARQVLDRAGARLVLAYTPALPPAEEAALLELVTTGGVPGGALTIPASPVDFRVTVESRPLPPAQEQALAEGVQVRLTLPAFPPHPSAGGVFLWVYGLYDGEGTLTGVAPLEGQVNADDGTYTGVLWARAYQYTAFLPVQVAPGG